MTTQHMTPLAALCAAVCLSLSGAAFAAAAGDQCTTCHQDLSKTHAEGAHKAVPCTTCHTGTEEHLKNVAKRPATSMDPDTCGTCHPAQYKSLFKASERLPRMSKKAANGPAPDPFFDRAMGKHGFTKEHAEPRAHVFMTIDQFIADRAFGGRFQPKDGWLYAGLPDGKSYKVWDVLKDAEPSTSDQKKFIPGSATAANSVCWSCKTTDLILDWAYLGDDVKGATFSRKSKPVELVRHVQHALNCNFCHDPHNAKPRITRDALIDAMTRKDDMNVYRDLATNPVKLEVKDLGVRGFTRKIAYMDRLDARLMCAQCHVEYICNPGFDAKTGKKIGFDSHLTNYFTWVNADKIEQRYEQIGFRDFKHPLTGASLVKMQHPDTETFIGSKHDKAGATCASCHMPKVKDESGKTYTLHWATSPKHYIKETCLTCHKDKTEEQMVKSIDVMKAHFTGKVREAEARMDQMFDAFEAAIAAGVDEETLNKARKLHETAHINWEYWTATNGGYFHNHDLAVRSLAKSAQAASDATDLLWKAIKEKNGAKAPAAKTAAAK